MAEGRDVRRIVGKVALYAAVALGSLAVGAAGAVWVVIARYEAKLPGVEELKQSYRPPQVTRVLARDGTLLGSVFTERRTVVGFASVPSHVKLAFLAAEDASFYEHEGLDYFGMLRALYANLRAGATRQGASTITQQVVKNLLLTPERTLDRKIKETILARRLEQELAKDEILWLYLNHIYLGRGRYGVEEASRYYFGKHVGELDLAEAALLAGLVAAPERFSPRVDAERSLARRRYVLGQMLEKGFVTRALYDQASGEPLRLAPSSDDESELAPEVVAAVRKLLEEITGESAARGGYTVHTTLDPRLQAAARSAVRRGLDEYAARQKLVPPFSAETRKLWGPFSTGPLLEHHAYVGRVTALDDARGSIDLDVAGRAGRVQLSREERYNSGRLAPSAFTRVGAALRVSLLGPPDAAPGPLPLRLELGPEAALVALDARSREVLALVGSYEALPGGLDRASRASRQPGSAFKPFVYGYALTSRRLTAASVLELPPEKGSEPGAGPRHLPLRLAIAKSDNAAAERVLAEVGAPNVVEWARSLGIQSRLEPTPSLALGAYEVTPLELTNAFASFASGGEFAPARLIQKIVGANQQELPLPPAPPRRRAISAEEAYLVTSLLRSVVESGTGRRAQSLGRPVAGKTGTTNRARDAWFAGYSTEIVASCWVGYDDAPSLGWGESGAVTALPTWIAFMKAAHEGRVVTDFPRPPGVVVARIDPATGLVAYPGQADGIDEEFLDGTVPSVVAAPGAGVGGAAAVEDEAVAAGGVGPADPGLDPRPPRSATPDAGPPAALEAGTLPAPPPF